MLIIGIGTDISDIIRFEKIQFDERFLNKFFTGREMLEIRDYRVKAEVIAGRFSAKEAVVKAMGTGFSGFKFTDIEILKTPKGAPYVVLHGKALEIAAGKGVNRFHISISHGRDYAVAFCIAEGGQIYEGCYTGSNEGNR